jgi:hypothetical protein
MKNSLTSNKNVSNKAFILPFHKHEKILNLQFRGGGGAVRSHEMFQSGLEYPIHGTRLSSNQLDQPIHSAQLPTKEKLKI